MQSKSLVDSGLLDMHGATLVGYTRGGYIHKDLPPNHVILDGDVLYIIGELVNIEFYSEDFGLIWLDSKAEDAVSINSLELARPSAISSKSDTAIAFFDRQVQVTVRAGAEIIGKEVRGAGLQDKFSSTVIAIKPVSLGGSLLSSSPFNFTISDTVLQAGDILVLNVGESQYQSMFHSLISVQERTGMDMSPMALWSPIGTFTHPADEQTNLSSPEFTSNFVHIHPVKEGGTKQFVTSFIVKVRSNIKLSLLKRHLAFHNVITDFLPLFSLDMPPHRPRPLGPPGSSVRSP